MAPPIWSPGQFTVKNTKNAILTVNCLKVAQKYDLLAPFYHVTFLDSVAEFA